MFKLKPLIISLALATSLTSNVFAANTDSNKNKLPEIGSAGFSVLSIEKERQIGGEMMRQIRASQPILNDPVLTEYINDLGNRMVRNAKDVNYSFEFFVIRNEELNAFAFFGGHIAIHSGLITTASTESELASVVAHEISHVTQRHLARRLESQDKSQPIAMASMISSILLTLINPSMGIITREAMKKKPTVLAYLYWQTVALTHRAPLIFSRQWQKNIVINQNRQPCY